MQLYKDLGGHADEHQGFEGATPAREALELAIELYDPTFGGGR